MNKRPHKRLHNLLFAATVFLAAACAKEPVSEDSGQQGAGGTDKPVELADNEVEATLGAGLVKTTNDNGLYLWSENDSISVYTTRGHFVTYYLVDGAGTKKARFKATLREDEKPLAFASYPVGAAHYRMDNLSVVMPSFYEVNDGINRVPMIARFQEGANSFEFSPVSGVLLLTMTGIPSEAASFQFRTEDNMKLTGLFDFNEEGISSYVGKERDAVTIGFEPGQDVMTFAVPLPAGVYGRFTVGFKDAMGVLLSKTVRTSGNVEIKNAMLKTLSEFDASKNIIYVMPGASGFGASWEDAASLSDALETAPDGAIIKMAAGEYVPDRVISGQSVMSDNYKTFQVRTNVTIQGGYPAEGGPDDSIDSLNVTLLSGKVSDKTSAFHVMTVAAPKSDVKVSLRGLTFSGGLASEAETLTGTADGIEVKDNCGAGVILASDAEIEGCTFLENEAPAAADKSQGGAVYVMGEVGAVLKNCTFKSNKAAQGGALSNAKGSVVRIERCSMQANSASHGGAITNNGGAEMEIHSSAFSGNSTTNSWGGAIRTFGSLVIENSVFTGNKTALTSKDSGGGAIQNNRTSLTVKNCVFEDNVSVNGGAICNFGEGETTVVKTVFKNNRASETSSTSTTSGYGGAVHNFYSKLSGKSVIEDCTFSGNRAKYGGALSNEAGIMDVRVCDLTMNFASEQGGAVISYDAKLSGNAPVAEGFVSYLYVYGSLFDKNLIEFENSEPSGNQGGAVKLHGDGYAAILNSTFRNHNGKVGTVRLRNGVDADHATDAWIVSCTFTENMSGLYNQSSVFNVYNTVLYGNTGEPSLKKNEGKDYTANQSNDPLVLYYSVTGSQGYKTASNNVLQDNYYGAGGVTVPGTVFQEPLLAPFSDGVYRPVGGPLLEDGMPSDALHALGAKIRAVMLDFREEHLLIDQKGNSRQGKSIMGALSL